MISDSESDYRSGLRIKKRIKKYADNEQADGLGMNWKLLDGTKYFPSPSHIERFRELYATPYFSCSSIALC